MMRVWDGNGQLLRWLVERVHQIICLEVRRDLRWGLGLLIGGEGAGDLELAP